MSLFTEISLLVEQQGVVNTIDFASQHGVEPWRVRLAINSMVEEGTLEEFRCPRRGWRRFRVHTTPPTEAQLRKLSELAAKRGELTPYVTTRHGADRQIKALQSEKKQKTAKKRAKKESSNSFADARKDLENGRG